MSQLAAQLQILSAGEQGAQTKVVKDTRFKTARPSFLFDSKTAANTDNQTIYDLGLNGFAELKRMDERFGAFEETLFENTGNVHGFDRDGQTSAVLEKLDLSIASFLKVLSPYFLLKPAHKVLEYLIRRYRVNDFNTEPILSCSLPFHETVLFGRMLQVLKLTPRWEFLREAQKKGAALARGTLVQRCMSDLSVLEFICQLAKDATKIGRAPAQHNISLNLYTTIVMEVLEATKKYPDQLLQLIIRYITEGLKSKKCPNYQTASSVLTAHLCSKTALSEAVLSPLIGSMLQTVPHDSPVSSLSRSLLPVISIFQTQKLESIPRKVFKYLLGFQQFIPAVADLCAKYNLDAFLKLVLKQLCLNKCNANDHDQSDTLGQLIASIPIDQHVAELARSLVDAFVVEGTSKDGLCEVLRGLNTHYPQQMDTYLRSELEHANGEDTVTKASKQRQKTILKLVSTSFTGITTISASNLETVHT